MTPSFIVVLLISPFLLVSIFAYILRCSYVECIYIYNCYIFYLGWSFDHYIVSFFVSYHGLYFKVYFIWYERCYSFFVLLSICMKYLFPAPHFQSVGVPRFEVEKYTMFLDWNNWYSENEYTTHSNW